jgi:hypothetical protein
MACGVKSEVEGGGWTSPLSASHSGQNQSPLGISCFQIIGVGFKDWGLGYGV